MSIALTESGIRAVLKEPVRVLMIVTNPCTNDTRVIKEAEALAVHGYEVCVVCKQDQGVPATEFRHQVRYLRVPMDPVGGALKAIVDVPAHATALFLLKKITGAHRQQATPHRPPESSDMRDTSHNPTTAQPVREPLEHGSRDAYRWLYRVGQSAYGWFSRLNSRLSALRPVAGVAEEILRYRPHVIHAHDLSPLSTAVKTAPTVGAKIVYDSHELERHRNGLSRSGRIATAFIESRYIEKVDRVITVSHSIADFLAATYKIMRPAVVMNAPDPSEQHTVPRTIRDSIGLERDSLLAVYVGKVTFGRGLEKLVEALQHCKEFHLALLGPRVASVEQDLLGLAYQRGVLDRVHVLDSVPPHDVVPYIITADVGIIPIQDVCLSYRFCMPNKLFEMTFAGIPVCVSDLPEMRAFIESERTGLIMDQTDPKDIARAMRAAYRDRHELRATGDRLERIKKRYSWSTQVEQLLSVYRDLGVDPS